MEEVLFDVFAVVFPMLAGALILVIGYLVGRVDRGAKRADAPWESEPPKKIKDEPKPKPYDDY